jgi:hypothetical protein
MTLDQIFEKYKQEKNWGMIFILAKEEEAFKKIEKNNKK